MIRVRGADSGYGFFRISRAADGTRTIEGETLMKLLEDGKELVLRSRRTTVIGADERIPRSYHATFARGSSVSEYTCRREADQLVIDAQVRGTPVHAAFPLASTGVLLDYNAPEHFEIFLRGRAAQERKFTFGALIVDMMAILPIAGRVLPVEEIATDGGTTHARRVEFAALGMAYRGWLDEAGHLARIEVPSPRFEGVRTERRIADLTLSAADLARSFSVPLRLAAGVADPGADARRVEAVGSARQRLHVHVGENRTDDDVLSNSHQRFEPAVASSPAPSPAPAPASAAAADAPGTWIDGVLTVTTTTPGARPATGSGRRPAPPPPPAACLAPEDAIESAAPEIVERARTLAPANAPAREAARLVADWVHTTLRYETQLVSALAAHSGRVGDCLSYSRLTVALLRARGVPARVIGGLALGASRRFGQHHWVEVWGGPHSGWFQIDPTYGQSTAVDAFHIDLWREGTFDGAADNWVELLEWHPPVSAADAADAADTTAR
ncbi:MAG: transglutaminase domain-containing protein [Planctomycetes bacterium]|nr:transglutaminase domain-containing protein [Planctomycetota bacterium]